MRLRRLNLNKKVLLTLLAVGLAPAAAGVALTARQLWTAIRDVSGDHLLTEARNIAVSLDHQINNFINNAAATVAGGSAANLFSPDLPGPDAAKAPADMATSLSAIARPLLADSATSRPFHLVTSRGALFPFIIAAEGSAVQPDNPGAYRALEARFAETRRQFVQPALKTVTVYTDPTLRRPVALAWVPVFQASPTNPLGWVGLEIPVAQLLASDVSRALLDVDEACVVTREGHLLGRLRFRPERVGKLRERLSLSPRGTPDKLQVHYDDGGSQLVGSTPLPTLTGRTTGATRHESSDIAGPPSDWYVCVARDLHPLAWDFRWRIARYLLAATALALILSIVASFLARRITQPIQALEQGVRRLA
ncbi:hypothetical protein FJY63_09375, partial [Candidatus Sumerlaeota bacterium]|nr:hypothetical protein [Candidatus Sumerlaeota bacterium]